MLNLASDDEIFTAKPAQLNTLLTDIESHRTALPNFQRPWVWEPQMVRDLLVSVAYRYPAGSLLTMPISTASFGLRPFEGAGETLKTSPTEMVLDGQQRLTSLYQALYRRDGVHVGKRIYHFYLDVATLLDVTDHVDDGESPFETALFYVVEERGGKRVRYEGLRPLYSLASHDEELTAGALPLGGIFDMDEHVAKWRRDYLRHRSNRDWDRYDVLEVEWDRLVQPWLDRIRTYPFPVVQLRPDMPLGAICHIFEKVNSTGVPLDVFDLCTAILWSQGFALNERWKRTEADLKANYILPMQPLSGTAFLQSMALLDALERKRHAGDERIAVSCRKQDLMAMRRESVERWWPVVVEGYREASRFLTENGVLSQRILPYTTLIIPLAALFADLRQNKGNVAVGAAWPKVGQWFWCSVFSQRYSSRVEAASAQDVEQLLRWLDNGDPPDVVRTFSFRADDLQEIASIRNAIYRGVLCLLARNGARDFGGGGRLSTALFYDTQQDHHHIFPTDAMKKMGVNDPRADTIVNKTLISASVNRSIGDNPPSKYVMSWRGRLGGDMFDEILRTHLIDSDLLSADRWDDFVNARRERLRQLIMSVCHGVVQPFTNEMPDPDLVESDDV